MTPRPAVACCWQLSLESAQQVSDLLRDAGCCYQPIGELSLADGESGIQVDVMSLPLINNYRQLLLDDIPMIDVRAPVEFVNGALPSSINLPLMIG